MGRRYDFLELRGRPVVVNVWTSWCPPCREEMPALQRVYQDYQDRGVVILGLNSTVQDTREAALAFATEQGLTFPILLDEDGEATRLYQVRALPTTFFIDAQGMIQDVIAGGPMSEALLRIRVEQLIEKSGLEAAIMLPVLNIGPLALQTPGLVMLIGLWLGLSLAEKFSAKRGVSPNLLYNLAFVTLVAGVIGARLAYLVRYPEAFANSPLSLISLNPGLLDPVGGLAVGA